MEAVGMTDTGLVRKQNQDAIYSSVTQVGGLPNLFIIADGMGGHKAGDVASQQAVARFVQYMTTAEKGSDYVRALLASAHVVNNEVYALAQANEDMRGMGTTFVCCVVEGERVDIVHVGDSRAYFVTEKGMRQITRDHTYAEELFRAGKITAEEARIHPKRHHLTRVLGFDPRVTLDGFSEKLGDAAYLLLCTDGLTNMLDDAAILGIIRRDDTLHNRVQALVDTANANGGTDNISAVLIDLHGGSKR